MSDTFRRIVATLVLGASILLLTNVVFQVGATYTAPRIGLLTEVLRG